VANLESRILDGKADPKTLEKILKNPETINSHTEIDATAFAKFKNILEKYQSRSLDQEEIKNEINKYTARDPNLDFDYKDKLSKLFSNDEIDKVILYSLVLNDPRGTKVNFQNRTENSIKDFPVLNPALIGEVNDIVKFCETQTATDTKAKIKEKYAAENPDLAQFLVDNIQINKGNATSSLNFAALYAFLQNQSQKEIDLTTTDGEWRKFPKSSDANELRGSIKGFNTGWCVQGLKTAQGYLDKGDFHIYYSKDAIGKATIPRLAIAMRDDQIIEVRGIAAKQNLDPYIANVINKNGRTILAEKLYSKDDQGKAVFPNSEQWLRADQDMKDLTILHTKFKNNQEFSDKDLFFIYEILGSIESFGQQADPRINEILKSRDRTEDFKHMMNLAELPTGELEKLRTQTDEYGNNALMRVAESSNKETVKLILNIAATKLNLNEFKTFLTQTNKNDYDALTRSVWSRNKEILGLIVNTAIAKLSPDEFKTFLTQTKKNGSNTLINAAWTGIKETVELIVNTAIAKLSPDEFKTFLTQTDENGSNTLIKAASNGNKETVELIVNTAIAKLSPDEFKTFLTQTAENGRSALTLAVINTNKEAVKLIVNTAIEKLNHDEFKSFLTQTNEISQLIVNTAIEELIPDEFKTFSTDDGNKLGNIDLISATQNDTQRINTKIVVVPAMAALGVFGGLAVALNSISENPVPWVPDLLPDYPEQVTNKKNLRVPEPPN
jgi:ankyrin repeat protein